MTDPAVANAIASQRFRRSPGSRSGSAVANATAGIQTAAAPRAAHRLDDLTDHLNHAAEHLRAARAASGTLRRQHTAHVGIRLKQALGAGHQIAREIRERGGPEGAELGELTRTIGLARSLSPAAKSATTAHLVGSVLNDLGHASRHAQAMLAPGSDALWRFNSEHSGKHLAGAAEHAAKLREHLRDNY